jgi:hypothetical protein
MSLRYPSGFISAFYNPLENPDAPTIGTATSVSSTSLSVTFTAPANAGGSAITGYVAVAKRTSDGVTFTGSGASSPITVTGLSTVAFTVTVFAINSYGPSALSAASNSVTPTLVIGEALGGGFFAGQISTTGNSIATHNLVIGPLSTAQQASTQYKNANTVVGGGGAGSDIDGPLNTSRMVADGNSTVYPAAHFCNNLSLGGQTDWYFPAQNELEVCYFNLKPTTENNLTTTGINANAVPARASNYTTGNPAQTSAAAFQSGGSEAFTALSYWSSTEASATYARLRGFNTGAQSSVSKTTSVRVRAVRRVAV